MGIEPTPSNGDTAYTSLPSFRPGEATGQFLGIYNVEGVGLARQAWDNPEFLWPSNQYMDISGRTHIVQRGYMRSLITDPSIPNLPTGAKNRRLFFQFNPDSLRRDVQQTPGAMNPLLQDPAQLMQPVPGTASFAFRLMFNREHEVASGYNDPNVDWMVLPNNRPAFVSEVGVLADLLVLDSITGQGISSDLIDIISKRSIAQESTRNDVIEQRRQQLLDAGDEEGAKAYVPNPLDEDNDLERLRTAFQINVGNSAFLNPLPFRVLFSSWFMVEGVATSVSVTFTKFSRTMIPTMCTVDINMYALYIGFAQKKTFLMDNLSKGFGDGATSTDNTYLNNILERAIKSATGSVRINVKDAAKRIRLQVDLDRAEQFVVDQDDKKAQDVQGEVVFKYALSTATQGRSEPTSDINFGTFKLSKLTDGITIDEGNDAFETLYQQLKYEETVFPESSRKTNITFSVSVTLSAKGWYDTSSEYTYNFSENTMSWVTPASNFEADASESIAFTNSKQYEKNPKPPTRPRSGQF